MFKILASVIFDDILNIKKEAETIAYCLFPIPYPHQKTFCCKPYVTTCTHLENAWSRGCQRDWDNLPRPDLPLINHWWWALLPSDRGQFELSLTNHKIFI